MQQLIFKKEEDYQLALIRIAREMVRIKLPLKLIEKVADSIYEIIKVRQVSIFLLDVSTNEYILQATKGRVLFQGIGFVLKQKDAIIDWFYKTGKEFYQRGLIRNEEKDFLQLDIIRDWLHSEKLSDEKEKNLIEVLIRIQFQMELLRTSLIIPCWYGEKIVGLLCLGGMVKSQYSRRDVELLSGFADDMAMNISNAFLIHDLRKEVHEKTLLSRERYNAYQRLETIFKEIISAFAMTVSKMDPDYTYEHVEKTSKYAQKLVDKLQPKQIKEKLISRDMFFAGILLHDIGKIFIPKNILNKPGPLNEEEWKIVRRHPIDGFELLKNIKGMEISAEIIRHHHERIDGKGYPDGLKGDQISIGAKIVCVVDSFEAMTADRPYRKAKSRKEALSQLVENSGTQFDSQIVDVFVELCEKGEI
jgi:HD-GYP domain-containing protein (c-di-GMP phosphodiesterase class II)